MITNFWSSWSLKNSSLLVPKWICRWQRGKYAYLRLGVAYMNAERFFLVICIKCFSPVQVFNKYVKVNNFLVYVISHPAHSSNLRRQKLNGSALASYILLSCSTLLCPFHITSRKLHCCKLLRGSLLISCYLTGLSCVFFSWVMCGLVFKYDFF